MARGGLDRQHTTNTARSLLDGNGTQPQTVQLIASKAAGEAKTLAVVVHYENNSPSFCHSFTTTWEALRMFFYIV